MNEKNILIIARVLITPLFIYSGLGKVFHFSDNVAKTPFGDSLIGQRGDPRLVRGRRAGRSRARRSLRVRPPRHRCRAARGAPRSGCDRTKSEMAPTAHRLTMMVRP